VRCPDGFKTTEDARRFIVCGHEQTTESRCLCRRHSGQPPFAFSVKKRAIGYDPLPIFEVKKKRSDMQKRSAEG
jgi:hypothetical protein